MISRQRIGPSFPLQRTDALPPSGEKPPPTPEEAARAALQAILDDPKADEETKARAQAALDALDAAEEGAEEGAEEQEQRADARSRVKDVARRVLGAHFIGRRVDGKPMSNREIKLAVLRKLAPDVDPRKPSDYIDARFDIEVERLDKAPSAALIRDRAGLFTPLMPHMDHAARLATPIGRRVLREAEQRAHEGRADAAPTYTTPHTAGRTPPTPIGSRYLRSERSDAAPPEASPHTAGRPAPTTDRHLR